MFTTDEIDWVKPIEIWIFCWYCCWSEGAAWGNGWFSSSVRCTDSPNLFTQYMFPREGPPPSLVGGAGSYLTPFHQSIPGREDIPLHNTVWYGTDSTLLGYANKYNLLLAEGILPFSILCSPWRQWTWRLLAFITWWIMTCWFSLLRGLGYEPRAGRNRISCWLNPLGKYVSLLPYIYCSTWIWITLTPFACFLITPMFHQKTSHACLHTSISPKFHHSKFPPDDERRNITPRLEKAHITTGREEKDHIIPYVRNNRCYPSTYERMTRRVARVSFRLARGCGAKGLCTVNNRCMGPRTVAMCKGPRLSDTFT